MFPSGIKILFYVMVRYSPYLFFSIKAFNRWAASGDIRLTDVIADSKAIALSKDISCPRRRRSIANLMAVGPLFKINSAISLALGINSGGGTI